MQQSLEQLAKQICNFEPLENFSNNEVEQFCQQTVVVLTAGGKGERLNSVTGGLINKNAIIISGTGESAIELVIKMYQKAGLKNFVALVFDKSDSLIDLLGNGEKLGVNISYSFDPGKNIGRGGAMLNALVNGSLDKNKNCIVHNPCDVIVDYDNFVHDIINAHLQAVKTGCLATVITAKSTPYMFTGMKIKNSKVEDIAMYPAIPVPAHIGVTIFSPAVYAYFEKLFNLVEKADFESLLFPYLCKQKCLYAFGLDRQCWYPLKDPKTLRELREKLNYQAPL